MERNKDAYNPRAEAINAIGSIDEKNVYSKGGHKGNFLDENPYYQQFLINENKQDWSALYERAIEWEADYANLQEQREYNREVLEEQRQYDSPVNQVARQRMAGINPDLSGSSGSGSVSSGSGAQMNLPSMADQQGQVKFANRYDDLTNIFNGINAGANLIGSLASGFSAIAGGISQLKITPSQIALNEANAGLANANANEVNALLDGKKKSLNLDNISKYIGQVSNLQGLLKNGFTDEEGTNLFNTLGIPQEEQSQLMQSIRGVHENPEILKHFHNNNLEARRARWKDKIYDDNTVESFTQLSKQIEFDQLQFQYADAYLKQSVMNALMYDDQYQDDLVATQLNSTATGRIDSEVALQNAYNDCDAWGALWDEKKAVCDGLKLEVEKLKQVAEEDGEWTEEEISNYTVAWSKYQACRGSLSNEFNNMRAFFIDAMQKRYERHQMMTGSGSMRSMDIIGKINYFSRFNFDSDYDSLPSGGQIAREWTQVVSGAARDLGIGVGSLTEGVGGVLDKVKWITRPSMGFQ